MSDPMSPPPGVDTSLPSVARMYDYMLGGKDNYSVDREMVEKAMEVSEQGRVVARQNRGFLIRAVTAAAEVGIDQFLDVGTGLPTAQNVHEVAQKISPDVPVVYVDNDPSVLAHGRALLETSESVRMIDGDVRQPENILDHPDAQKLLDFSRPMAVLLVAVLHFVADKDNPAGIVETFKDRLAPGSWLILSHYAGETEESRHRSVGIANYSATTAPVQHRFFDEVADFFGGWEMQDPGLTYVQRWRPDPADKLYDVLAPWRIWGGVAIKP